MNPIADNLARIHKQIKTEAQASSRSSDEIILLAVSKTKPVEAIQAAFEAGQRAFGENYVQEALEKIETLSDYPIEWHFIGAIQSNKTRAIAENFDWAHGVASFKHAKRLSEQRPTDKPPLNICLQINISGESSKSGITPDMTLSLAQQIQTLPGIKLRGLMALPAPSDNSEQQARSFAAMQSLLQSIQNSGIAVDTLSMGMSNDMEAAIRHGSTIVRIGTAIFGARD